MSLITQPPSIDEARTEVTAAEAIVAQKADFFERIVALEESYSERGRAVWESAYRAAQRELTFALSVYEAAVEQLDIVAELYIATEGDEPTGDA